MRATLLIVALGVLLQRGAPMAAAELGFFELAVSDLTRAKAFYGELFGWRFSETPSPDFVRIDGAGIPGGMILDVTPTSGRPNVKIFFKVRALRSKLALAQKLGAVVVIEPTQVSPTSTIAEFRDRDSNVMGMICEVRCAE